MSTATMQASNEPEEAAAIGPMEYAVLVTEEIAAHHFS
jgi:hypothetical protein